MKKILSMAIAGALAFAGSANAADVEAGVVKVEQQSQVKFLKNYPLAIDDSLIKKTQQSTCSRYHYF